MKTVLTSVLLCAFLQMVWLSLSTGQTGADPALECSDFKNNSIQCCGNASSSCIFYQCSQQDSDGQCVSSGASPPDCPENETATATCNSPSTTQNPGDPCIDKTDNKTACCGVDQCGFFHCNKPGAENATVCALKDSTKACTEGTQSNNTCKAVTTTTPPVTTPPHPDADACAKHNNSKADCCAAASADGCVFYKCENNTVCLRNTTAEKDVCTEAGVKPAKINCTETPTPPPVTTPHKPTSEGPVTSPTPTKAPSGSGSGGRHFDGASFIGGIVLCAGIFAIGYFGLKFYKSRQERNYHTL